jgi:hypothetical protein
MLRDITMSQIGDGTTLSEDPSAQASGSLGLEGVSEKPTDLTSRPSIHDDDSSSSDESEGEISEARRRRKEKMKPKLRRRSRN